MKDEENYEGLQWSESGDHLLIKDISFLTNETLPKYFKHNNLSSFIRQLNMYDFRKSTEANCCIYSHPHFKKAKEHDYRKIKRKSRKMS